MFFLELFSLYFPFLAIFSLFSHVSWVTLGTLGSSSLSFILMRAFLLDSAHFRNILTNAKYDFQKVKKAIEDVLSRRGISIDSLFNDGNKRNYRVLVQTLASLNTISTRTESSAASLKIPGMPWVSKVIIRNIVIIFLRPSAKQRWRFQLQLPFPIQYQLAHSRQYVNGALRNNNHVEEMEAEAQNIWCLDEKNTNPWLPCDRYRGDAQMRRLLNEGRFFRFDLVQRLQSVGLAAYEKQGSIVEATNGYLDDREQQTKLRVCTENFVEKEGTYIGAFLVILLKILDNAENHKLQQAVIS